VNSRTFYKTGDYYYSLQNNDTLHLDTKYITIKFKHQAEQSGQLKVINNHGLQYIGKSANLYYIYKITGSPDYPQLIGDLNLLEEVDQTILSFAGKFLDDKQFPNDPGNQYFPLNVDEAWWVGATYDDYPQAEYLNLTGAWGEYTTGDPNLSIGIIDMGNDWSQADMPSNNMLGWNFVTGTNNTYPDHSVVESSHGTKITSIICSKTNNNTDIFGVAGGWQNDGKGIKPIMIVNGQVPIGGGNFGWSTALTPLCIDYAVAQGARVINMSFGVLGLSNAEQQPIRTAIDNAIYGIGHEPVICIASSGNYNSNSSSDVLFPASYEPVIAVGGVDIYHTRWDHGPQAKSSFGPELDFVTSYQSYYNQGNTPSGALWRLGLGGGTSFSAAMLTGVVGLMLSVNPCLTPAQVFEALKASCYKTPQYNFVNGWNNQVGYGFPNAKKAIEASMGESSKTLSTNETWTTDRFFRGNITIPSGKTLTLQNMTLRMWDNAGIIVKKGGILLMTNSIATATCQRMWEGITVEGDYNLTQIPSTNQGRVSMQNSIIEFARIGIKSPNGGGIIYASSNSSFLNNTQSVSIANYLNNNNSTFSKCTFKVDFNHRDYGNYQYMVRIDYNKGVKFYGCNFLNDFTQNDPNGYGIFTYGGNFIVDGTCNSQISPCPESDIIPTVFSNLQYGIYAMNTPLYLNINHASFISNNCGLYFSHVNNAKIWNSNFQIPTDQTPDPRGAYIDYCSGFHIEKNTFNCNAATHADEVGLYLMSTGSSQNYVFNNTFTNLFRGSVADGYNRHETNATGLCYKCNDFSNNALDIDVIRGINVPITLKHGINPKQGLPSFGSPSTNKDTLAASNTFSQNPYQYNIHNINQPSNYYRQEFKNPGTIKNEPNPTMGISKYINYSTTYYKPNVCKTWIPSGNIQEPPIESLVLLKEQAEINAEVAAISLVNAVDGGNTNNLTFEVLGSTPSQALELRNELLQKSPYLSDTVMKTAIDNENVLPNAMLRDILVENPQSAKNEEIMDMLNERWEPMPDYMKSEIGTGTQVIGGREQLEAERDGWIQQQSFLLYRIVNAYLGDTLNPDAVYELKTFLQGEQTVDVGFLLADISIQQGDYISATQILSEMQQNFQLNTSESQLAADYLSLNSILSGLKTDSVAFNQVDSTHAIPLLNLYNSGENIVTAMARDILISSGLIEYQETINVTDLTKLTTAEVSDSKPAIKYSSYYEQLSIFPNPAVNYCLVEYTLPSSALKADICIHNINGIVVWQQNIFRAKDQLVIDLSGFSSGIYTISLRDAGKTVLSKTLSVTK
jgi:hypothetical protein